MLRTLRKGVSSWIVKILFALLVASFALWGIQDVFTGGGQDPVVATVGDAEIMNTDLQQALNQRRNFVRQRLGRIDPDLERQLGLLEQSLQQLISEAIYRQTAQEIGLDLSEKTLAELVRNEPVLQGPDGQFSRARLEQLLFRAGLSEQQYLQSVEADFLRGRLVNAIAAGVAAPAAIAGALYRHENQRRMARYFTVPLSAFGQPEPPETEALRAYYEANQDAYALPEYRSGKTLAITIEELAKEITVPEEALRAAYADRKDSFGEPERRTLRQVVLDSKAEAEALAKAARESGSLADAAALADTAGAVIPLGTVTRDGLPLPTLTEPAFAADEGAVIGPVETTLGWHVLEVQDIEEADVESFEDVRGELRAEIAERKAFDAVYDLSIEVEDMIAGGSSLEEAGERLDLPVTDIRPVDPDGRPKAGGELVDLLADNAPVREAFFDTPEGQISTAIETQEGDYYFLKVDRVEPARVQRFEEVRERVAEAWQRKEKETFAIEQAESLAARLRQGAALADLAAERGVDAKKTRLFSRANANVVIALTPALIDKVFALDAVGDVATGLNRNGVTVLQLAKIEEADPGQDSESFNELRTSLRQAIQRDLLTAFETAKREQFEVDINQQSLEAFFPEWFESADAS